MPGPQHGWIYLRDRTGAAHELINPARTAAYLSNPAYAINGISPCDVLGNAGCNTYIMEPNFAPTTPGYAQFNNADSNYLSVPDSAGIETAGDITLIAYVVLNDWTPSATNIIASRWPAAPNQVFRWGILNTGRLYLGVTSNGTTEFAFSSTANPTVTDGNGVWLATTLDVNNGASGKSARFWQSAQPPETPHADLVWSAIGTNPQTIATVMTLMNTSTAPLRIGVENTGAPINGRVYSFSYNNGIGASGVVGGTPMLTINTDDFPDNTASTFTATTGGTVTINRSGGTPMSVSEGSICGTWSALSFTNPTTDLAPWYNANYPQSAQALGFLLEEWTGLDDGHVRRTNTPWGGYGGGAALGAVSAEGRTMKIGLYLFGGSEEAVEYLFRWLGSTLMSVCQTCATDSILFRRFCGTTANPLDGLGEIRNVGLIEGLKWESEPGVRADCHIRRASFTLMAGDPCIYLPDTEVTAGLEDQDANLVTCFDSGSILDTEREFCRPSCSELPQTCRTVRTATVAPMGAMAPIVTFDNAQNQHSFPFRVVAYYAANGQSWLPNPCGLQRLGELYVKPLPAYSTLRWDVVGRDVEYRDVTTGGFASGFPHVDANDPPLRRFFALPCGTVHIVVEPASMCADFLSGDTYELGEITYDPPMLPTVTLSMAERVSCP